MSEKHSNKISKNVNQFLDIAEYIVQILCKLENKQQNTFLSSLNNIKNYLSLKSFEQVASIHFKIYFLGLYLSRIMF